MIVYTLYCWAIWSRTAWAIIWSSAKPGTLCHGCMWSNLPASLLVCDFILSKHWADALIHLTNSLSPDPHPAHTRKRDLLSQVQYWSLVIVSVGLQNYWSVWIMNFNKTLSSKIEVLVLASTLFQWMLFWFCWSLHTSGASPRLWTCSLVSKPVYASRRETVWWTKSNLLGLLPKSVTIRINEVVRSVIIM